MENKLTLNFMCEYLVNLFGNYNNLQNELITLDKLDDDYDLKVKTINDKMTEIDRQIREDLQDVEKKADNYAYAIKHFETNAEICKLEAKRLLARAKNLDNVAEKIKQNLQNQMLFMGFDKMKTELHNLYFRSNKSVKIMIDPMYLPKEFRCEKIEYSADKIALKKLMEIGSTFEFARFEESRSLVIR